LGGKTGGEKNLNSDQGYTHDKKKNRRKQRSFVKTTIMRSKRGVSKKKLTENNNGD